MHAPGENDFLIPSANPPDRSQRPTRPGFLFTLLLAVGVFGVSTGAAHFFFPRGLNGRPGAGALKGSLVERGEDGYETWECAGNRTGFPVMEGADLVSYFSLPVGEAAMYGTEEYQARYNGYTFFFVSEENKALFEVRQGGRVHRIFFFSLRNAAYDVPGTAAAVHVQGTQYPGLSRVLAVHPHILMRDTPCL